MAEVPVFVPVALTGDEAKAVANASAAMIVQMAGLISRDHPLITGALKIEKECRYRTGHSPGALGQAVEVERTPDGGERHG